MSAQTLTERFLEVRQQTEQLCEPLVTEDYVIQAIDDVSPPKWHLAHTTWFFETFILKKYQNNYHNFNEYFHYLFNSYYQTVGSPYPRPKRGLIARPTVADIYQYRHYINEQIAELLTRKPELTEALTPLIILGIQHEQQHQELLLMDIKYNFSINPLFPSYSANKEYVRHSPSALEFISVEGGLIDIGADGEGFCFDNELPRHAHFVKPYAIANRLISNGEYLEFITAQGYQQPQWWLSDGWDWCLKEQIKAPLYWHHRNNHWFIFTLNGLQELHLDAPVSHISFYEADAFARWKGYRLPTEEEWEHYVFTQEFDARKGNLMEDGFFHPLPCHQDGQFIGDLWEWTTSAYTPYPGFRTLPGSLGEYNGKFMNNQRVLRGGSCVTPRRHNRISYRNFFQPEKRWQFSGIRLAFDN